MTGRVLRCMASFGVRVMGQSKPTRKKAKTATFNPLNFFASISIDPGRSFDLLPEIECFCYLPDARVNVFANQIYT